MDEHDIQADLGAGVEAVAARPDDADEGVDRAADDRRLVDRCLAGEEAAWETLYHRCHPALIKAIRYLFGNDNRDANLVEEIAARVWYLLLKDDGQLLGRFDPERDCRLQAYLTGFARNEILQYLRSERRRRSHEATGGRILLAGQRSSHWPIRAMIDEFAATLNDREQQFLEGYLLSPPSPGVGKEQVDKNEADRDQSEGDEPGQDEPQAASDSPELSQANIWQRRHRLRFKLKAFLQGK